MRYSPWGRKELEMTVQLTAPLPLWLCLVGEQIKLQYSASNAVKDKQGLWGRTAVQEEQQSRWGRGQGGLPEREDSPGILKST